MLFLFGLLVCHPHGEGIRLCIVCLIACFIVNYLGYQYHIPSGGVIIENKYK
jgi:hypothetical protein